MFIDNKVESYRGRLIQKKNDDSMSAVIVSTFKPHAQYILKEYNNSTKEFSMYEKIWSVGGRNAVKMKNLLNPAKKNMKNSSSSDMENKK